LKNQGKINAGIRKEYIIAQPSKEKDDFREHGLKYSFEDFDNQQSKSIDDWDKLGHLRPTFERFFHYSKNCKVKNAFDDKFKTYGDFPKDSKFKFPSEVTPDANWGSMHIGGKPCIAGHLIKDTFYIVFFDPEHEFYPVKKK
jgi:hypothetical protein